MIAELELVSGLGLWSNCGSHIGSGLDRGGSDIDDRSTIGVEADQQTSAAGAFAGDDVGRFGKDHFLDMRLVDRVGGRIRANENATAGCDGLVASSTAGVVDIIIGTAGHVTSHSSCSGNSVASSVDGDETADLDHGISRDRVKAGKVAWHFLEFIAHGKLGIRIWRSVELVLALEVFLGGQTESLSGRGLFGGESNGLSC